MKYFAVISEEDKIKARFKNKKDAIEEMNELNSSNPEKHYRTILIDDFGTTAAESMIKK